MEKVSVMRICPFCGQVMNIDVPFEDYLLWSEDGLPIQKAMPYLPRLTRETLISSICIDCLEG